MAGWGLTEEDKPSEDLKALRIPIISDSDCTNMSRRVDHIPFMTSDKICAGYFNGKFSKLICVYLPKRVGATCTAW